MWEPRARSTIDATQRIGAFDTLSAGTALLLRKSYFVHRRSPLIYFIKRRRANWRRYYPLNVPLETYLFDICFKTFDTLSAGTALPLRKSYTADLRLSIYRKEKSWLTEVPSAKRSIGNIHFRHVFWNFWYFVGPFSRALACRWGNCRSILQTDKYWFTEWSSAENSIGKEYFRHVKYEFWDFAGRESTQSCGASRVLFITPKIDAQVTKRRHICIKGVKRSLRRGFCRSRQYWLEIWHMIMREISLLEVAIIPTIAMYHVGCTVRLACCGGNKEV
jgi:hypothetical protein